MSYDSWQGGGYADTGSNSISDNRYVKDKDSGDYDTRGLSEKLKAFNPKDQKGALDYMMDGMKWSDGTKKVISSVLSFAPGVGLVNLISKSINGEYTKNIEAVKNGMIEQGVPSWQAETLAKQVVDNTRKDMVTQANSILTGNSKRDTGAEQFLSSMGVDPNATSITDQAATGNSAMDNAPEISQLEDTDTTAMDTAINAAKGFQTTPLGETALNKYNTAELQEAIQGLKDINVDILYQHSLAELSGIGMDKNEKALLMAQKEIAMDRALTTIEDTFAPEGDAIVAQQINNLGANALGGTVGQGFIKRWQEREANAKTGALQDIESTYLGVEREAITQQKQRQVDIWNKQFDADVIGAQLDLEKAQNVGSLTATQKTLELQQAQGLAQQELERWKTQTSADLSNTQFTAGLEADKWKTQSDIDLNKWKTTEQLELEKWKTGEILEDTDLDRLLKEKMGDTELKAWEDSNKWGAFGNIVGGIGGSIASNWMKSGSWL